MAIADSGDAGSEIQFAAVVRNLIMAGKLDKKVAGGLVGIGSSTGPFAQNSMVHLATKQVVGGVGGFDDFSIEKQFANLRQVMGDFRVVAILELSLPPEPRMVERDPLTPNGAKHHRADMAVANGKSCIPLLCRLLIPQFQTLARFFLSWLGALRGPEAAGRRQQNQQQDETTSI